MTAASPAGRRLGRIGVVLLLVLLVVAIAAPLLAPYDPVERVAAPFAEPSLEHPLGADDAGRDLMSQLLYGGRVSLAVGVLAAALATIVGTTVGLLAGWSGRVLDATLMRLVDMVLALPLVPLALVVGVFLGPGLSTMVGIIAAVTWANTARELRSQVLSLRERDDVLAARMMGAGHWHVGRRYLLPAVGVVVIPQFVLAAKLAILLEAALTFLGLGSATTASWGAILSAAHARSAFLTDAWVWWVLPPGLAIAAAVLGFALVGFALEERSNPQLLAAEPFTPARVGWGAASVPAAPPGPRDLELSSAVLAIHGLTVDYAGPDGAVRAVDGVDLHVGAGESVGIVGESGSGKTTLTAAALGVLPSSARRVAGSVRLVNHPVDEVAASDLRQVRGNEVGVVGQDAMSALNPVMRIDDQLIEAIRAHHATSRRSAQERARAWLEQVGVPGERAHAWPHELSGGMRQRAVVAMALVNEPRLLIADEPTSGLDVIRAAELVRLLDDLREELGLALLVVSHDLPFVLRLVDRLVVLRDGRVVEQGDARRVATHPTSAAARRLVEGTSHGPGSPASGAAVQSPPWGLGSVGRTP